MKKFLLLAALPVLGLATPAQAQTQAHTGPRIEGLLFYDKMKTTRDAATDEDLDSAFGAAIGYDFFVAGPVTLGLDVEYTNSTADRTVVNGTTTLGNLALGSDIYAGGRLTAPVSGDFEVALKAGYTSMRTDFTPSGSATDDLYDESLGGYRLGAAIHYTPDEEDGVYYGVEYRYSNYKQGIVRNQIGLVVGARF